MYCDMAAPKGAGRRRPAAGGRRKGWDYSRTAPGIRCRTVGGRRAGGAARLLGDRRQRCARWPSPFPRAARRRR
ncbi:hypothetical protein SB85_09295 [Xanthomonas sacchari]|nr:hypothetical protein SB85_09295 [Xanthomonas sacchari]